jgi:Thioredoxin
MTHEARAKLIKRLFFLFLLGGIVAGVWFYPKPKEDAAPQLEAKAPENGLLIVHHHLPGDPASEQLADVLNKVQSKYGAQVVVSRVDFKQNPAAAKEQGVTKPPHVVIFAGEQKVFDFQGFWSQAKVEYKVEEILRGLKRVGKDWRPTVPGMTPAGS